MSTGLRALLFPLIAVLTTYLAGMLTPALRGPWEIACSALAGLAVWLVLALRAAGTDLRRLQESEAHWRLEALARREQNFDWTQSRHLFERMAEATPDILYIYDVQTRRNVYANRGGARIMGHSSAQVQAHGDDLFENLVHPDDRGWVIAELAWFAEHGTDDEVQDHQLRMQHKDGSYRWLRCRSVVFARDKHGRVRQILGISQDVTEQRRAAEALRESETRFRVMAEAVPQIVWCSGTDGQVTYLNQRWAEYTGLSGAGPEDLDRVILAEDRPALDAAWQLALLGGTVFQAEFRLRQASTGQYRWFLARSVPLHDAEGHILGWYGTSTDVHEHKCLEEKLDAARLELEDRVAERTVALQVANEEYRLARDAAEAANRAKDQFLANMSHEIRTPIAGILGMTALTLDSDLALPQRDSLTLVKQSAEGLLSIINDVLDYSKIAAGKLTLDPRPFRLRSTLDEVQQSLQLRAGEKGIGLSASVVPEIPDELIGDAGRLRQVLLNLMGNAVKFTDTGRVEVHVACESSTAREVFLHVSVTDTGIGISPHQFQAIFAPFVQADGSLTRKYGGTGLGLSIAAQLAGLMGGRIWVESVPGQGSTFHFTARLERPAPVEAVPAPVPAQVPATATPLRGLNILLAEDHPINQKIAVSLLRKHGHSVQVAGNGRECLDRLAEGTYDIILMDVQMPEMDGMEATAAIRRAEAATGHHLPIIAVTAHAMTGDRERFLDAGMDGYVTKPFKIEGLLAAIAEVVHPASVPCVVGRDAVRCGHEQQSGSRA